MSHSQKRKFYIEGTGINRTYIAGKVKKELHSPNSINTIRKPLGLYPEYWEKV